MFSGQVIPPAEPLPNLSEDQIVWSNHVSVHKIEKNGTIEYTVEFAHPSKVDVRFVELVRRYMIEAAALTNLGNARQQT